MFAFVLILLAVLSRVLPHAAWFNFTAVGGSLLYFGARRPLKQAAWALLPLFATDYYLTVYAYGFPFHLNDYLLTWSWYAAVLVLGSLMLKQSASAGRLIGASVLAPTAFFGISNFTVWSASGMYPHSLGGLGTCYLAALPFYRNDLASTLLVTGLAFGLPVLLHRSIPTEAHQRTA